MCLRQATRFGAVLDIDEGVVAFSWVDDTFFVLRKAVARSVKCRSVLAAAATLHDVVSTCPDP